MGISKLRGMFVTAAVLGIAASASAQVVAGPSASTIEGAIGTLAKLDNPYKGERRIQRGPILVIEHRSDLAIDHVTILVDHATKKELVVAVLESGFPKQMGADQFAVQSLEAPTVQTIEEYVDGMIAYDREARRKDPSYPFAPKDRDQMLREAQSDLGQNFAVVYRYIYTGKKRR